MSNENQYQCLLGSSIQPSNFVDADGRKYTLGDVVAEAHNRSGRTIDEWNEWARTEPEAQEAALQAVVDSWGLKPEQPAETISEPEAIKTAIRASHTLATLEISLTAYEEIKKLLLEAGYDHAFDGDMIDMTGIGLVPPEKPDTVDIFINSIPHTIPYGDDGYLTYEEIRSIVYPDAGTDSFPSCTWIFPSGGSGGIISPGKKVLLARGMRITMMYTG